MTRNAGTIDRVIWFVAGIGLLAVYGAQDAPWKYLSFLGLVLLGTALTGVCPRYSILGIKTCRGTAEQAGP